MNERVSLPFSFLSFYEFFPEFVLEISIFFATIFISLPVQSYIVGYNKILEETENLKKSR